MTMHPSSASLVPLPSKMLAHWDMLTIHDIRRQNLALLYERFGGASRIVEMAAKKGVDLHPVYLSQLKNQTPVRRKDGSLGPPRGMGDELARDIEAGLGLERGWMDNIHRAPDVLAQQLLYLYENLSLEAQHALLIQANERFNAEHPNVSSPANPFARAPAFDRRG